MKEHKPRRVVFLQRQILSFTNSAKFGVFRRFAIYTKSLTQSIYPLQKHSFANTDVYLRCVDGGSVEARVVPFELDAGGGGRNVADFSLDQLGTTVVNDFLFSSLTYPNAANPHLDGKTVLVMAVKDNNDTTQDLKYIFVDLQSLVDVYAAKDSSIDIADNSIAVNISASVGNLLSLASDGLFVAHDSTKVDVVSGKRTLADVQQIFQSGLGKYYFKAGDYFDITIPKYLWLRNDGSIAANSTWRVVCLGIDHNADIEGYNRGHFCIGRATNNTEIAFYSQEMNHSSNNANAGGWAATEMRRWLNSSFFDVLSPDLQAVITPCDNNSKTNPAEATLLKQYDYYKNGNSCVRYHHTNNTSAIRYFTRSPRASSDANFIGWQTTYWGNPGATTNCVVPCFTIS